MRTSYVHRTSRSWRHGTTTKRCSAWARSRTWAPPTARLSRCTRRSGARGRGIAAAVLTRLVEIAREAGYTRVSLETGTQDFFEPAHRLYERHGFTECGPFDTYVADPHSRFYTRNLSGEPG